MEAAVSKLLAGHHFFICGAAWHHHQSQGRARNNDTFVTFGCIPISLIDHFGIQGNARIVLTAVQETSEFFQLFIACMDQ